MDISDGDNDFTLDSDGDGDPKNDLTETIISSSPSIEVTKTSRVEDPLPEFVSFGQFQGTNESNWSHITNNQRNDGFITSNGISKPGEYFEFNSPLKGSLVNKQIFIS